jgi:hypothetical protein
MREGTTADNGRSRIIDERATRARDRELVRTLEANGLTLLAVAVAVARRVQHPFDRVADLAGANPGRDCQIFVLDTRRSDPGRGVVTAPGAVATTTEATHRRPMMW